MGRKGNKILISSLLLTLPFLYIVMRVYWIAFCRIPGESMFPTLQRGDYIVASLQVPGRRICSENENGTLSVRRKGGRRPVKKGDIVVFNYPYAVSEEKMLLNSHTYYCKRCSAVPGEIYRWSLGDNQDSIYLPRTNDILRIDSLNYRHYKKCIEYETGKVLSMQTGDVLLGDSIIQNYRFQKNYYFLCGDNQKISYDSRLWGILPEDFIMGTVMFIYFSKDPNTGKIRWDRLLKI